MHDAGFFSSHLNKEVGRKVVKEQMGHTNVKEKQETL